MPKKHNSEQTTTLREHYDSLPFKERKKFRDEIRQHYGWTESQWRNRILERKKLSKAELFMLENFTKCKHRV